MQQQLGQANGEPLPEIVVVWDEKTQNAAVRFDVAHFKTFPFLKAVLQMAIDEVEKAWRTTQAAQQMQALQKQAFEQQKAQEIANKLQLGRG